MTAALMVDLSSNNGTPDLAKHWAAGYRVIALKATEGTGYVWAAHDALGRQWHKLGGRVCWYHFARPGNGAAQARDFLAAVDPCLGPDDSLAIDCEVGGVDGTLVNDFIRVVHQAHPDRHGLIYGGASFLSGEHIRPVDRWGLWLADYPANTSAAHPDVALPAGWSTWTAWQSTDKATVPGIPGRVDQSHITGWLLPDKPKPAPKVKAEPLIAPTRDALHVIAQNMGARVKHGHPLTAADKRLVQKVADILIAAL